MNISNNTTPQDLRIILTRTVHNIDTVSQFNPLVLDNLLDACDKLNTVLVLDKAQVSSIVVRELIDLDIETLKENVAVISSAIRLNRFKFEHELNMN